MGEWSSLPPAALWERLLHQGGPYWPMGLARPLATAATLLRYAMREGAVAVVSPLPDVVGRVLPVSVRTPHDRSVPPNVVLHVGEPPARHVAAVEVPLISRATKWGLLKGHTLQPMGEGPLLAFPRGRRQKACWGPLKHCWRVIGRWASHRRSPMACWTVPWTWTWTWRPRPMRTTSTSTADPTHMPDPLAMAHNPPSTSP